MRLALGVEYDGSAFSGYQFQAHAPSVQAALQTALSQIADEPLTVTAAGRTDAGVHATAQVVSFTTSSDRPERAWIRGTNTLLPESVGVRWVRPVDDDFHPRYQATARRYMYVFHEAASASPLLARQVVASRQLDDAAMHRAAGWLLGEQDFSAYRGAGCQSASPHRSVHHISVARAACFVVLDVTANAFLLHMVRNIAGSLWQVGLLARPPEWLGELLRGRDRTLAAPTAPPQGLYLVDVRYPRQQFPAGALPPVLRALGGLERF